MERCGLVHSRLSGWTEVIRTALEKGLAPKLAELSARMEGATARCFPPRGGPVNDGLVTASVPQGRFSSPSAPRGRDVTDLFGAL